MRATHSHTCTPTAIDIRRVIPLWRMQANSTVSAGSPSERERIARSTAMYWKAAVRVITTSHLTVCNIGNMATGCYCALDTRFGTFWWEYNQFRAHFQSGGAMGVCWPQPSTVHCLRAGHTVRMWFTFHECGEQAVERKRAHAHIYRFNSMPSIHKHTHLSISIFLEKFADLA